MKPHALIPFAALALVACGPPASTTSYTASLTGGAEVPAVTTSGTGSATATLDGTTLTVSGTYSNLSGAATAAHIHGPAAVTASAGVVCPLTVTAGTTAGTGTLAGTCNSFDIANLNAGMFYVNVHTAANPGGEIRGQLRRQ